jgi:hypothetical protein
VPTYLRHEAKDVHESIHKFMSGVSAASIVAFLKQYRRDEIRRMTYDTQNVRVIGHPIPLTSKPDRHSL